MALEQLELTTGLNKVDYAIRLLQEWQPPEGYYLADSGGKDSSVIRDLLIRSGCKFDAHYSVSPIDPPQVHSFLREYHPDTQWDYYAKGFWNTVAKKGLPLRQSRWCCKLIKESGGSGRMVVTGIRAAESSKRNNYQYIRKYEYGNKKLIGDRSEFDVFDYLTSIVGQNNKKVLISPILTFSDYDVWQYIRENNIDYCSLYDEGFDRIGCILCPFSRRTLELEIERFPQIVKLWRRACDKIVERWQREGIKGKHTSKTGQELFDWWINRE